MSSDLDDVSRIELLRPDTWITKIRKLRSDSGEKVLKAAYTATCNQPGRPLSSAKLASLTLNAVDSMRKGKHLQAILDGLEECRKFTDAVLSDWRHLTDGGPNMAARLPAKLIDTMLELSASDITETDFLEWIMDRAGIGFPTAFSPPIPRKVMSELLPTGWWTQSDSRGLDPVHKHRDLTPKKIRQLQERLNFLASLNPSSWWEGRHLSDRVYYVAEFKNMAVADSPQEGNALYYLHTSQGDWKAIFGLTKSEALEAGAGRVIHDPDGAWRGRIRSLVRGH